MEKSAQKSSKIRLCGVKTYKGNVRSTQSVRNFLIYCNHEGNIVQFNKENKGVDWL